MSAADDRRAMAEAIGLAERGRGRTRPNPIVGSVVVRDGEVVGRGWHERAGGPHAEVVALRDAGERAQDATVYVTLEPCSHTGRTPPCTEALIDAGVARVVAASRDPNPVAEGGLERLQEAGIEVEAGVLEEWADAQNEVYLRSMRLERPFVTLKLAQTRDGRLSLSDRRWVTGPVARRAVHRLRSLQDAVMVGSGTVLADNPGLDVRDAPVVASQPRPVVVDRRGRTSVDCRVVGRGALILAGADTDPEWRRSIARAGAEVLDVSPDPRDEGVDLRAALKLLHERSIQALLVEGGQTLARSFVDAGLVDRLVLHVSPEADDPDAEDVISPALSPPDGADWSWYVTRTGWLGSDLELVAEPMREGT